MEIWKPIQKYTNYEISSIGRFKNTNTGRILKPFLHENGYWYISIAPHGKYGKKVSLKIHRLVAEAFIPNPENKPTVNHIDGDKLNNHILNLEWATHKENSAHAFDKGLSVAKFGEEHGSSILTEELIEKIRRQLIPRHPEYGVTALARKYGLKHNTLSDALNGKTWKHLNRP